MSKITDTLSASTAIAPRAPAWLRDLSDVEKYGLVYVWMALLVVFSVTVPAFFRPSTLEIVVGSQATQIVVTLAVMVALLGGEFDLSVGNVIAVTGSAIVVLNGEHGWPWWLCVVLALVAAGAYGAINAFIVVGAGVPSIIATLGTGTLIYGAASGWSGTAARGGVDEQFIGLVSWLVLGLPLAIYVTFAIGLALYYVLEHTPIGRRFVFAGQNLEVARLAGIRVTRLRAGSLIWSAVLSAVAGILLVGLTGASVPSMANGYMLPAFAGAFLGSTVIRPGRFNVPGVFIAIYFLVSGVTGLQLLGYTGWVNDVFYGASLVVAVVLTQVIARRRRRASGRFS
jgi:ribose transport system permease protein